MTGGRFCFGIDYVPTRYWRNQKSDGSKIFCTQSLLLFFFSCVCGSRVCTPVRGVPKRAFSFFRARFSISTKVTRSAKPEPCIFSEGSRPGVFRIYLVRYLVFGSNSEQPSRSEKVERLKYDRTPVCTQRALYYTVFFCVIT